MISSVELEYCSFSLVLKHRPRPQLKTPTGHPYNIPPSRHQRYSNNPQLLIRLVGCALCYIALIGLGSSCRRKSPWSDSIAQLEGRQLLLQSLLLLTFPGEVLRDFRRTQKAFLYIPHRQSQDATRIQPFNDVWKMRRYCHCYECCLFRVHCTVRLSP